MDTTMKRTATPSTTTAQPKTQPQPRGGNEPKREAGTPRETEKRSELDTKDKRMDCQKGQSSCLGLDQVDVKVDVDIDIKGANVNVDVDVDVNIQCQHGHGDDAAPGGVPGGEEPTPMGEEPRGGGKPERGGRGGDRADFISRLNGQGNPWRGGLRQEPTGGRGPEPRGGSGDENGLIRPGSPFQGFPGMGGIDIDIDVTIAINTDAPAEEPQPDDQAPNPIEALFKQLDSDGDGKLSLDELIEALGGTTPPSEETPAEEPPVSEAPPSDEAPAIPTGETPVIPETEEEDEEPAPATEPYFPTADSPEEVLNGF